jgi:hypothetical protein
VNAITELSRVLDRLDARDRDEGLRDDGYGQAVDEVREILHGPGAMKVKLAKLRKWAGA